jgi:hypothetical protein
MRVFLSPISTSQWATRAAVAMKLTGHKTEAVYRRYAIVAESDLREAGEKLSAALSDNSGRNSVTAAENRLRST